MKKFKYYQTFATKHIRVIIPEDQSKELALASLDSLKNILPSDIQFKENPDLIFNCFNAAVVNAVNLNDDGIMGETALAIYKNFNRKFLDLEHNRKHVVGTIISAGFSEKFTNNLLTEDQVKGIKTPFNITLGGVVWHMINSDFADMLIKSSDDSSPYYESISASWELGFNDYQIALGSRNLADAEIITDPKQIEEFQSYLRANEGQGKTKDNIPVYRIITSDALPLGIGYSTTPAADVRGVMVVNNKKDETTIASNTITLLDMWKNSTEEERHQLMKEAELKASTQENLHENKKNHSHAESVDVKNNSIMKLTKIEDITDDSLKELSASAIKNFAADYISTKIDENSTDYAQKLEAKEKESAIRKEAAEAVEKKLAEAVKEMDQLKADLQKEKEARAAQKVEDDFNRRMTDLDSQFDLGDKERGFIAKDIKGLDDNAYATWFEKFEVYAAKKKKKMQDDDPEDDPTKGGDSGDDEDMEDAKDTKKKKKAKASIQGVLDNAEENKDNLPPNSTSTETSILDEFKDAFKPEDFKIKR